MIGGLSMKTNLSFLRTNDDKLWERQMELSRGNRFEEMFSFTIYRDETAEAIGFIRGILYSANFLNEFSPKHIYKIRDCLSSDKLTRTVLVREYAPEMNRNILALVAPIVCESTVPAEEVLKALQLFVEDYYGCSINSIYSFRTKTRQWGEHSLPRGKTTYEFFPGKEVTNIEDLLVYDYEL